MKKTIYFILILFLCISKSNGQCEDNSGTIVISEVYFDTHYNEDLTKRNHTFGEYIELYNSSNQYINLEGWVLKDNRTIYQFNTDDSNNLIISPGGYKIVTYACNRVDVDTRAKFMELFPEAIGHDVDIILQTNMVLYNDTERIRLFNPSNRLIDDLSYINGNTFRMPTAKTYLGIPLGTDFTINIQPKLDNNDGGFITGRIGDSPVRDANGEIIYPIVDWTHTDDFKKAIFRSKVENYYTNGGITFEVANATPFSLPPYPDFPDFVNGVAPRDIDPFLFSGPDANDKTNYTESFAYDIISGDIIGHSKNYFDELGKISVALNKDFKTGLVWGTETLYDSFGRKSIESFPAVSLCSGFKKMNFLSDPVVRPLTLDMYYSDSNSLNEYQATATQPYSEVKYDELNPSNVINVVGGNQINSEWKTGYTYTIPAAQEMYYVYGYDFFEGPTTSGVEDIITKYYKTVIVDANGVENVVFTDGEGKTLAKARAGGSVTYPVISLIGTQGFVDIHIPLGVSAGSLIAYASNSANYNVFDLQTGLPYAPTGGLLPPGHAYRVTVGTIPTTDPKTYVDHSQTNASLQYDPGALGVLYNVNYYDYDINVYNKTGQLVKNIQPNGFNKVFTNPFVIKPTPDYMSATDFSSTFTYNDLGQIKESSSSDEGLSKFAYRNDGQIRYSQNALQATFNKISYTNYDDTARPIESGIITGNATVWTDAYANPDSSTLVNGTKSEQFLTIYDFPENNLTSVAIAPGSGLTLDEILDNQGLNLLDYVQNNLSGNVAVTFTKQDAIVTAITWYSYDIYGRVEWLVVYNESLGAKTIHYQYDYKGNVIKIIYQKDNPGEYFVHNYTYDLNNVLKNVSTTTSSATTNQVDYDYYVSGELQRVKLLQIAQGLDYTYTLGGLLKCINHPSLGLATGDDPDSNDFFGEILDYYPGDYHRTGKNFGASSNTNPDYTGNIKAVRWSNKPNDVPSTGLYQPVNSTTNIATPSAYNYTYDRNHWLTGATYGTLPNTGTGNITTNANYKESGISYDSNGNISFLQRSNENGTVTDNLVYHYSTTNNWLNSVVDGAPTTSNDLSDLEGTTSYQYNAIGQLTRSLPDDLRYYYNAQGLVTAVWKGNATPLVRFYYNERGQRIKKETLASTGETNVITATEYSVYDVSGNLMAIYTKGNASPDIVLTEQPIYGLNRIGTFYKADGSTAYEIKDHLGNVRDVVVYKPGSPTPIVLRSYTDYYPFGEPILHRSAAGYRFAFQGQQLDAELGMEAFQLRLWDGRIGRWLSPDPGSQYSSPYLGMGNNPISMMDGNGGWAINFGCYNPVFSFLGSTVVGVGKGAFGLLKSVWFVGDTLPGIGNFGLMSVAQSGIFGGMPNSGLANTMIFDAQFGTHTQTTYIGLNRAIDKYLQNLQSRDPKVSGEAFGEGLFGVFGFEGLGYLGDIGKAGEVGEAATASGSLAANEGFNSVRAFKNAISPFKGGNLTNAGRAVTKHPEYFGFESTEALMEVYRTPGALNNLGSSTLKDILRNGAMTTGAGGRYPNGWSTYTLPNGNAASWELDGTFIGFRGLK